MKSLWIAFTRTKKIIENLADTPEAFELNDIWVDYDRYDRTIEMKIKHNLDSEANEYSLLNNNINVVQFYIEEWEIQKDVFIPKGFTRVGYGTFKEHKEGKIKLIDVVKETPDIEHLNDLYND